MPDNFKIYIPAGSYNNYENIDYKDHIVVWRVSDSVAKYGIESEDIITITGLSTYATAAALTFNESSKKITLNDKALDGKTVTLTKGADEGYTLALADDVDKPENTAAGWTVTDNTATYKTASNTAGYTLSTDKKSITYDAAPEAQTLVTINNKSDTEGLTYNEDTKLLTIVKGNTTYRYDGTDLTIKDKYAYYVGDTITGYTLDYSKVTAPANWIIWTIDASTLTYTKGDTVTENL